MLEQYIQKIHSFYEGHRRMPTYAEMAKLFEFKSKNAVAKVVEKLVEAGMVTKDSLGRLIPATLLGEVKMLGYIEAGIPSPTEQHEFESLTLDEWLITDHAETFILTVKGDSMEDAGIFEGDYVLVERTQKSKAGDIVVADIDGLWTLKYLRQNKGGYYLQAGNKKYQDMHPQEELKIGGVVRSVIRRYGR